MNNHSGNQILNIESVQSKMQDAGKSEFLNLYKNLLDVFDTNERNSLACTPAVEGEKYSKRSTRFMLIGRSMNGAYQHWEDGLTSSEYAEKALEYSFNRRMQFVTEKKCKGCYNHMKTSFWQLGKKTLLALDESIDEEAWAENIVWSNLYKVAHFKGGNPDSRSKELQLSACIKILEFEIDVFKPTHILFVTNWDWFEVYNEGLLKIEKFNSDKIVAKGVYSKNSKVVVCIRPELKKRQPIVEDIVKEFNGMRCN